MPGLVPGIHLVPRSGKNGKTWMPASRAMTIARPRQPNSGVPGTKASNAAQNWAR